MPAVINTNLASMFAQQSLNSAQGNLATSVQRLSSGLRINSAKDDAAGLAVAQNMQSQINAMNMSSRNIGDATNMLATADASLGTIQDMLLKMKSLIVEGKNDSLSAAQRGNIATEINELNDEISKVAIRTTFNGNSLLSGAGTIASSGTGTQVGEVPGTNALISSLTFSGTTAAAYTFSGTATSLTLRNGTTGISQTLDTTTDRTAGASTLNFSNFGITIGLTHSGTTTGANLTAGIGTRVLTVTNSAPVALTFQSGAANTDTFDFQTLNVRTNGNAAAGSVYATLNTAMGTLNGAPTSSNFTTIDNAIDAVLVDVNSKRATFGAQMNRVTYISSQLLSQSGNLQQSRSTIADTDFAAETARLTKGQIMQQAATAMLAQANQMPNVILSLLK